MADTFVAASPNEGKNYGAATTLAVCDGCTSTEYPYSNAVALLRFDTQAICPGSTIERAVLHLDTTTDNLGNGDVKIFVVLEAWNEGSGTPATPGAANWENATQGVPWKAAGVGVGSRESTQIAQFNPSAKITPYSVTIPAGVVQKWLTMPASNFGLVLTTDGGSDVQFYSRESALPAKSPGLVVTSTAP